MTAASITMKGQIRIVTVPAGMIKGYAHEDDYYDEDGTRSEEKKAEKFS